MKARRRPGTSSPGAHDRGARRPSARLAGLVALALTVSLAPAAAGTAGATARASAAHARAGEPGVTGLTSSPGGACAGADEPALVNRIPTVEAVVAAPAGAGSGTEVSARFRAVWHDASGDHEWLSPDIGPKSSGSTFSVTLPPTVPQNITVAWSARGDDGTGYGPWSDAGQASACHFVYDGTPPAPPAITSNADDGYPDDGAWHDGVGRYGKFTLTAADSDVAKYEWGLNGDPTSAHEVATADGAPVTVDLLPPAGVDWVSAEAVDRNGNHSAPTTYYFRVSTGRDAKAAYALDEPAGSPHIKDGSGGNPADVHGGAVLGVDGLTKTAMRLNGVDGYAATSGPVVDTAKNFAVSAWARPSDAKPGHSAVIATQAGAQRSGFELYYSSALDRWAFGRYDSDSADAQVIRATSTSAPHAGEWTHLLGVYDTVAGTLTLYVDGRIAQSVPYTSPWNATGPLQIGAGSYGGAPGGFFAGDVDDVRIYDRIVTAEEAVTLSARPLTVAARWKLNEATGDQPATSPDDGSLGHDLTLADDGHVDPQGGWIGNPPGAMVLDGNGDYAATAGPVIHTNQSFSVAGWVETSGRPTRDAAIFSQEGAVNSAFTLRYAPDPADPEEAGGYQLDMPDTDAAGAAHQIANHRSFQSEGDWDHVAIVYDAPARQMRLYVNGQLDQSVSTRDDTVAFDATGPFEIGRTKTDGQYGEYWQGMIDDVWAFGGVLSDTQIAQLAGGAELPTDQF